MSITDYLMGFPRLYVTVQDYIATALHRDVKAGLSKAIPDENGIEVLDIGCGVGNYSNLFSRAAYTGLDWDDKYIQSAQARYGRDGVTFLAADATRISFPTGHFNYAFSVGLYHHLSDDAVIASLSEALRVAGSGQVIVYDAIYPLHGNLLGYLLRKLDRGKFVRTFKAYSQLLNDHFSVQEISAHRAELLDYIYYRL